MRLDDQLDELAARQHACVAIWQLRELGASRSEIARLRQSHRWAPVCRRVLRLAGAPSTEVQLAMAAVLEAGPGGRLSHAPSAALWALGAWYRLVPSDVMTPAADRPHAGELGRLHPLVGIPARWLTSLNDVPVVRPELTIYQLCGTVHPKRAERALDTAWSMGLVSGQSLKSCLEDLAERGRNGTVVLRALLRARPDDYVPPATGIEARFQDVMSQHGLGEWRRQVDCGGATWAGRVDFKRADLPLIAEIQSERFHAALSSQYDDAARRDRLRAAGFVVVEVWDVQVWHRPRQAAKIVRAGVADALRQVA